MKNGLNEKFRKNGILSASENYKDDKLDGLARYFDAKGYLSEVKYYVDGTEMASVNIETDVALKNIYDSYKQEKFGKSISKRNLWYIILWLVLNTGNDDMMAALEKEMKMYALSVNDMIAYKKYSADYDDITNRLYFGLTPFSYAVNLSAPTEILQRFQDQIDAENARGTTPLQEAVRLNKVDMIKYILLQIQESEMPNFTDILFYALKNNAQPNVIELLLQQNFDISATDESSDTLLLCALKHQHLPETIRLLIKAGARADVTDAKGRTPLFYAVKNKVPYDVLQQMLQAGANIEEKDGNSDTLLLYGIKNNDTLETISTLLELGANPNVTDSDGYSPLSVAIQKNRDDVVRLLLKFGADTDIAVNTEKTTQTPILLFAYKNKACY